MPSFDARSVKATGTGASHAGVRHEFEVFLGEVRVIENARHEVRRTAHDADSLLTHESQHLCGIPDIEEIDGISPDQRAHERAQHPHEMADGRASDRRRTVCR